MFEINFPKECKFAARNSFDVYVHNLDVNTSGIFKIPSNTEITYCYIDVCGDTVPLFRAKVLDENGNILYLDATTAYNAVPNNPDSIMDAAIPSLFHQWFETGVCPELLCGATIRFVAWIGPRFIFEWIED